jgi:hypothetical protein
MYNVLVMCEGLEKHMLIYDVLVTCYRSMKIRVLANSLMHDDGTVDFTFNSKNEDTVYCHVALFYLRFTKGEILMCSCTKFDCNSSHFLLVSRTVERGSLCHVYSVFRKGAFHPCRVITHFCVQTSENRKTALRD